jgi:ubiquitin-like 1-activating enzyme E1 A
MTSLTVQESEIYDRQIRLWGIEAQQRLQSSRVLLAGRFSATSAEISKNLVLAGFSATIMDPGLTTAEDLGANFLLDGVSVGKNRAVSAHERLQELNPMVQVTTSTQPTTDITTKFINVEKYNVVVLSGPVAMSEMIRINQECRKTTTDCAFFYVDMYGFIGVGFSDLGENFSYRSGSVEEGNEKLTPVKFSTMETTLATLWSELASRRFGTPSIYYAWHCLIHYMEQHGGNESSHDAAAVKSFGVEHSRKVGDAEGKLLEEKVLEIMTQCHGRDVGAACAIMGGLMGQEIVKSIARKSKPLQNVFVLDAFGQVSRGGVQCTVVPPSLK